MRMSVRHGDPGYNRLCCTPPYGRFQVHVDGVLVPKVITADEEAGYVLYFATDSNGDMIFTEDVHGNRLPVERVLTSTDVRIVDTKA